jgi:L-alanine-DL-glutamate epimerase-like enolase superfamily enzyme
MRIVDIWERPIRIGTLDMTLWDAAAKITGMPLHRFVADRLKRRTDVQWKDGRRRGSAEGAHR